MLYHRHIIKNFPYDYPLWKKILANLVFFFGATIIHSRNNLLTESDLKKAKNILKKGDVILVGGLKRLSSLAIRGPVTHTILYTGWNCAIHSIADGVVTIHLHDLLCEYDTMIILRHRKANRKKIKKVIDYAFDKIGKPYDFEFNLKKDRFYCTELIYHAFKSAGLEIEIKNKNKIIRPVDLIGGNFELVFKSHNLKINNNGKIQQKIGRKTS